MPLLIQGQNKENNLDSLYQVGVNHYGNKEYNLAIASFSEVLKLQPSDLNTYFNRAAAYFKIGDKQNACNDWGQGYLMGDKEATTRLEKYCDQIIIGQNEFVIVKDSLLERVAHYPDGDSALFYYIYKNVIVTPGDLPGIMEKNRTKIGGDEIIRFVILSDGTISNPLIVQSVSASIDSQVLKLLATMPKWQPALIFGKPVGSRYTLKIPFYMEFVPDRPRSRGNKQKL